MALTVKTIKTKLRSMKNIKKITKTMEMVAAAKMRKAVAEVLLSRHYAREAWQVVANIAGKVEPSHHPLLEQRAQVKKIAVVLFSSNRGLCGGFNSQVVACALEFVKNYRQRTGLDFTEDWIVVGKKGAVILARKNRQVAFLFEKPELAKQVTYISAVSKMILDCYQNGSYYQVILVYTDFLSALNQKPKAKVLLPIQSFREDSLGHLQKESAIENDTAVFAEYLFEPTAREILDYFLPHLVTMQIYQALLESNASEHSSRMAAMRNASDATSDMIDGLTLTFNQARQAGITREIAEIAGAKAAMN